MSRATGTKGSRDRGSKAKPRCRLCAAPLQSNNNSGFCSHHHCRYAYVQSLKSPTTRYFKPSARCRLCATELRVDNSSSFCRQCRGALKSVQGFEQRRSERANVNARCRLCAAPLFPNNNSGFCCHRHCRNVLNRALYHALTPAARRARLQQVRIYAQVYRAMHREERATYNRAWRARNSDHMKKYHTDWNAAHREERSDQARSLRRLRGVFPSFKRVRDRHPNWSGGRFCFCVICGAEAGWYAPYRIKGLKTGPRCRVHMNWRRYPTPPPQRKIR